ncbi:MAG: plasmid pRiA4b ORF-3 family protein [Bacteroidia bacterium]|jgi:hypothetical protein|nr:plasmid pRiA4b ORF-3 family protein [Bacteroidia bacterium]
MNQNYLLHLNINSIKPEIWRKILVKPTTTLFELHHIIQISMGWQNYHLYEFNVNGYRMGSEALNGPELDKLQGKLIDSIAVDLSDLYLEKGSSFSYEYDFGDSWRHTITIEDFVPSVKGQKLPLCLAGERACPPEDCGGIHGFENMIEILQDKSHPEYKEFKRWVGPKYNPETFDLEKTNKSLRSLNRYIRDWLDSIEE